MNVVKRLYGKIYHSVCVVVSKMLRHKGCVYMFHSIGDPRHDLNVSVDSFERFLHTVVDTKVIRLEEWMSYNDFVCLTFDDVADSFYYNAFPLLKKYRIPFTVFVSCSLLDTEKYITTDMLKDISECDLCTVGSHGWAHSFYGELSIEKALNDLSASKNRLKELTNKEIELYAFPYGSIYACGLKNTKLVREFYRFGFGTIASPITQPSLLPDYFLPRINVDESFISNLRK